MTIALYDFQARGLDEGRALYRAGKRSVLFVGPTGMGKTTLAAFAARGRVQRGGVVAAFAHRLELVKQMADRFTALGMRVAVNAPDRDVDAHVMMTQTALARRGNPRGAIPKADFAIFDEAHHYVSDEWSIIPKTYLEQGAKLMGLSATPERDDGRPMGEIFDGIVCVAQVVELVKLNAIEPKQGITPIEVLEPVDSVRRLAKAPVDAYLDHCPGRSAVVFAPNVKNAEAFVEGFRAKNVDAEIVHGELASEARGDALTRFARGDLRVLVNVAVLTEGWDAPVCDVCILARKIGSLSLLYQCVGRARRPFGPNPNKRALLIDLAGNIEVHGPGWHPDDELEYSLDGVGCGRKGSGVAGPRICRVCKRVLDEDIAIAAERGRVLEHCPECKTKLSKIVIFKPEEIELARVTRDEARAKAPPDKRTKALVTLYAKALREGHKRTQAEIVYRRMFRGFPPNEVRIPAWKEALALIASEKGDAWEPRP